MKRLKNLIERIFTKKNIKIFLLLFVIVGFFVGTSFAQSEGGGEETMSLVEKLSHCMHVLISILSWGWVIFATLAGKFMTNDFVYGTFLHLDKVLWNLWNIMKNFANIALGCVLVVAIVKNLFSVDDKSPIQRVKDTVVHTLIAGVLIQMSWFLIAALFDLSTIATVAVGSLPSQFMASNTDFQKDMRDLVGKSNTKVIVDFRNQGNIVETINTNTGVTEDELNKFMDTITPSSETVVGPLLFLGASVFNMYDLSDSSKNESGSDDRGDLVLSLGINGFIMISFTLMLALMFLFNLFRVITLWVIIPLTPFIILLSVFKGEWKKLKLGDFLGDISDYSKVIKLVFKPVYMTLVLSIILIVMVLVRSLIKANGVDAQLANDNVTIQSKQVGSGYNSSMEVANVANIEMNIKESLVDLLIYFLGLALMAMLMKSCFTGDVTGIKFIDKKIEGLSDSLWGKKGELGGLLGNMGVLPIGRDENGQPVKIGLGKAWDYLKGTQDRLNKNLDDKEAAQDIAVRKAWGLDKIAGDFDSLNNIRDREEWIKKAMEIGKAKGYTRDVHFTGNENFRNVLKYFNKNVADKSGGRIKSIDVSDVMAEMEKDNENGSETED